MSVIDQVGPFRLHAVGEGKPWIKWSPDVNQLWLQYFIPVLSFESAAVQNTITLKWQSNTSRGDQMTITYHPDWLIEMLSDNTLENYTSYVIQIRETISKQIGSSFKLERCMVECDEDGVALIDELNSAWMHYRLTRD